MPEHCLNCHGNKSHCLRQPVLPLEAKPQVVAEVRIQTYLKWKIHLCSNVKMVFIPLFESLTLKEPKEQPKEDPRLWSLALTPLLGWGAWVSAEYLKIDLILELLKNRPQKTYFFQNFIKIFSPPCSVVLHIRLWLSTWWSFMLGLELLTPAPPNIMSLKSLVEY